MLSRREFSRAVGAAALFSPFFSLLNKAHAQTAPGRAKYLLLFLTSGTDVGEWSPAEGSSETNIAFRPMNEPLAPIKSDLLLIEKLDSRHTADNHGQHGGLTGFGYSSNGQHISVDQFVADGLRAAGIATTFPDLRLGGISGQQQCVFFRGGQSLSPIFSPTTAFDTIFGGAVPGNEPPSALLRRRRSTLDLLRGELTRLSNALGAEERQKLELHADSLRQVEERLDASEAPPAPPVNACTPPGTPSGVGAQPLLDAVLHIDLAINAFACDLTRVASVEFGHHQSTPVSLPDVSGDWHNDFMHADNSPRTRLTNLERWLSARFVDTVNQLKARPAPDGNGTLFDQTLLVWARDMGHAPGHSGADMRFAFSGGAGGYLNKSPDGRYVDGGNAFHFRALLNCCEAMGISDFTGFGDPQLSSDDRTPLASIGS